MHILETLKNTCKILLGKSYYSKIYKPYYNFNVPISQPHPKIFNQNGKEMEFFFIRDKHFAHFPYGQKSRYFIWDRYNIGLKTHFYTHDAMLETMGNPERKFGFFVESEAIVPEDYKIFEKHKGLESEFNAILTFSDKLLNTLPNAIFLPYCSQVWYGTELGGGVLSDKAYESKKKNVSMVSSDKILCDMHKKRLDIIRKLKSNNLADTYGSFDGGKSIKIHESLTDYRFSICLENFISDYFFTERVTNCFASMTVPIYYGAKKITDFFNPDGMIILKYQDLDNIDTILKNLDQKAYEERLPAIIDNYRRVQPFLNLDDYLYNAIQNK